MVNAEVEEEFEVKKKRSPVRTERTRRMKMRLIEKLLEKDPKLNAKFEAMADAELSSNPPPRAGKRGHGRPYGGKVTFSHARIEAIPNVACAAHVAKALGIKRASFQQWCNLDEGALPSVKQGGHRVFRKDILVKWLIKTGRYSPPE